MSTGRQNQKNFSWGKVGLFTVVYQSLKHGNLESF